MQLKKQFLFIISLFAGSSIIAQSEVFNISDHASYETCDAIMHDSNGGLVPYGASDNNTITLCPPAGETQINLYFIGFNLSADDNLSIYDGVDMSAPLIGTYGGETLLFETVSPTNATGCLTVHFEANGDNNVGDFSARISCGIPCDYPVALMAAESDTMKVCVGEQFTIDASASSWTEGVTLAEWTWDLGDDTSDEVSWPTLNHAYNTPGGYRIRLYLTDANDCSSANIPEIVVLVSTPYTFQIDSSVDALCIGDTVHIGNNAYLANTAAGFASETQNGNTNNWTENNNTVFDNGVFIPDNQGCFYAENTFNQFGTTTIDEASDISTILVNMEHSFVGDIIINIICPTGEVLSLWPEAGGSGTYLGEPIDVDDGVPGIGYDYTWSPTSTNGTWLEGMGGFGGTVPAGDYEPEGDWADLFGCPLNGTWQLEICDVVGADDGWVFEFGIQFAPQFYPDILTFTPSVGNDCDSSYWSNQNLLETIGAGCDWATFVPTEGGVYTFVYTVTNDFGCTYNDEITITAVEPPVMDAGDDTYFCGQPLALNSNLANGIPNLPYTYVWTPATSLNNANAADPIVTNLSNEQEFIVTAFPTQFPGCTGSDTIFVTIPAAPPLIVVEDAFYCIGENTSIDVAIEGDYLYSLYYPAIDATGLLGSNDHGNFFVDQPGTHFVTLTEPLCGFVSQSSFIAYPEVCEIKIPNVFSPNEDGKNEAFVIYGVENFPGSTLQIFDRWGNLIYDNPSYNNSWTARDQADGTYYFIFGHNLKSGMVYYESHLTILRDKRP